jgi:hypothetical protein
MIEAGKLQPTDLVSIDGKWYGPAGWTSDGDVILAHESDGTILSRTVEPWTEFWTAGERLAELRGELDEVNERLPFALQRAGRSTGNQLRSGIDHGEVRDLRADRDRIQAEILALEDMGVTPTVILGGPERCGACGGSGETRRGDRDVCDACAGSGRDV